MLLEAEISAMEAIFDIWLPKKIVIKPRLRLTFLKCYGKALI